MAQHCFKLQNLTASEMRYAKDRLAYFVRHGVKVTFLKKVVYIHLDEAQKYTAIGNLLSFFRSTGRLQASEKNSAWLQRWHRW